MCLVMTFPFWPPLRWSPGLSGRCFGRLSERLRWAALLLGLAHLPAAAQTPPRFPIQGLPFWEWQAPQPTGYGLNEFCTLNDSTMIAVGNHGTAVKTTNSGRSWRTLSTGATREVTSVSFANSQVGWIGTETPMTTARHYYTGSGEVRRTTDGGQSWTVQNIGENVLSVTEPKVVAVSPTEAYLTYRLTGRDSQGFILGFTPLLRHTTDGGQTWPLVTLPLLNSNFLFSPPVFTTSIRGFMLAVAPAQLPSQLLQTTNGGQTWQNILPSIASGYIPFALTFLTPQLGWLLGLDIATNTNVLYKTTNGGTTWAQVGTIVGVSSPTYLSPDLSFSDPLHGLVSERGNYYCTTDGGLTWAPGVRSMPYTLFNFRVSRLRPGGSGWAVGGYGSLYRTLDYGNSWQSCASVPLHYGFKAFDLSDPAHGWAVPKFFNPEDYTTLLHTTRRGAPWQVVKLDNALPGVDYTNTVITGGAFPDADTGWVAVESLQTSAPLLRTTDGGRSWVPQPLGLAPAVRGLSGLGCWNTRRAVAIGTGPGAALYATRNGGRSWVAAANPLPRRMARDLVWADSATVYANTDSAEFLVSRDAGRSWRALPKPGTNPVYGFYGKPCFTSATVGYWAEGDGVWKTTDGGQTWNYSDLSPLAAYDRNGSQQPNLQNISFRTARAGWAFGANVFQTQDAGQTWALVANVAGGLGSIGGSGQAAGGPSVLIDRYNAFTTRSGVVRYSEKFVQADTLAVQPRRYCAGQDLTLAYTVEGSLSAAERTALRVQLSNPWGRFRRGETWLLPPAAGGTATALRATLPAALPAGTRYRLRVITADSALLGGDNGRDLTISPLATATLTPAGPQALCAGGTLTLTAPAGQAQYLWSTGATTRTLAVTAAGSYSVQVAGAAGCLGPPSAPVAVTLVPLPAAGAVAPAGPQTLCAGSTLTLTAPAGAAQYLWSTGATTRTLAVSAAGSYTVQVSSAAGCRSAPSAAVAVALVPLPAAPVLAHAAGGPVAVAAPVAGVTYQWFVNGTVQAGVSGPRFPATGPAPVGTYAAVAVGAAGGCVSAASAPLAVLLAVGGARPPGWALYPNPADALLWVELVPGGGAVRLTLCDALGRTVRAVTTGAARTALDVRGLPEGTYTLRAVLPNGQVLTQPVLVRH